MARVRDRFMIHGVDEVEATATARMAAIEHAVKELASEHDGECSLD